MEHSKGDQRPSSPAAPIPTHLPQTRCIPTYFHLHLAGRAGHAGSSLSTGDATNGNGIPLNSRRSGLTTRTSTGCGADIQLEKDAAAAAVTAAVTTRQPLRLTTLPQEIQLLIVAQLDVADMELLRRSSHYWRALVTRDVVVSLVGRADLDAMITRHCRFCLYRDQSRRTLLYPMWPPHSVPPFVLCVECARREFEGVVVGGRRVMMADGVVVALCRWCGWPIRSGFYSVEEFHPNCSRSYRRAWMFYLVAGCVQLSLGVVAVALAWRYFRNVLLVFAPTVISFLLVWMCFVTVFMKGDRFRTCAAFVVELAILGLWVPPIYAIAKGIVGTPAGTPVPRTTVVTLVFFAMNMLFRLLNVIGNVVVSAEYDVTRCYRRDIPHWQKWPLLPLALAFTSWTNPTVIT